MHQLLRTFQFKFQSQFQINSNINWILHSYISVNTFCKRLLLEYLVNRSNNQVKKVKNNKFWIFFSDDFKIKITNITPEKGVKMDYLS